MIVILQLVRRLSECSLSLSSFSLCSLTHSLFLSSSRSLSLSLRPLYLHLCPFRPLLPMCILRGCMPAHQAAQRRANQTGQPAVRILIKLSVTPEQRAQRVAGGGKEGERQGRVRYAFARLRMLHLRAMVLFEEPSDEQSFSGTII